MSRHKEGKTQPDIQRYLECRISQDRIRHLSHLKAVFCGYHNYQQTKNGIPGYQPVVLRRELLAGPSRELIESVAEWNGTIRGLLHSGNTYPDGNAISQQVLKKSISVLIAMPYELQLNDLREDDNVLAIPNEEEHCYFKE